MLSRRLFLGLALFVIAGCASQRNPGVFSLDPDVHRPDAHVQTWPPASEDTPRYAYIGELRGEENFIREPEKDSALGNFWRWLTGLGHEIVDRPRVTRPHSVLPSRNEQRIYVADVGRQSVLVFDRKAGELLEWTKATPLLRFSQPIGLAETPAGGLYVTDAELGAVVELDSQGEPVRLIGQTLLQRPTGLVVDSPRQRLWVADTGTSDLKVFDMTTGQVLFVAGELGEQPGEFNRPTFLALHGDEIYVSDTLNARVQILRADDGSPQRAFGKRSLYLGSFVRPKGISLDSEGNIYVVESYHDQLLVFDPDGRLLINIGGTGTRRGEFYLPSAVYVDWRDQVYVGDVMNGRIMVMQFLGGDRR